ncbi:uncharacterized protein GIQ15_00611 [Arthroderma uncinatum]|uniref:uncharacterized protein n=1 Tax=Arthroderma uncinatum TaxID=74035 RepID=UPI00144AF0A7|nr:uncharacterized protein GIQ15_00611 [Arthroderma uncinatum]KAF3491094.1 integral membrane protein [Arthroderma uncinatum]
MKFLSLLAEACLLAASLVDAAKTAQFRPANADDIRFRVNIPTSTASTKRGPIYFQIRVPSGVEWVGLGQGSEMAGSNIFMLYSAATGSNVTLSPRAGLGEFMPEHNPRTKVTLLSGSGITEGRMVANVRCDNCLSWEGGQMDPTDAASSWIWAVKMGAAIMSNDVSKSLMIHDTMGAFNLDLTKAVGDDENGNPFVSSDGSNTPNSGSDGTVISDGGRIARRSAHGLIMSIVFLVMFPSFALTLHLIPGSNTVPRIHAPLQAVSLIAAIVGFALGLTIAKDLKKLDSTHAIIGIVVMACVILLQPALGLLQHLHFRKTGKRAVQGILHAWLGRCVFALAIINGGLGLKLSGIGTPGVPRAGVIAYCIIAAIMAAVYISVVLFMSRKPKPAKETLGANQAAKGSAVELVDRY